MRGSRLVTTERVVCIAAPDTGDVVDAVADCVTSHGLRFVSHEVGTPIEDERLSGGDILGVAVGGDGTFLSAAEVFAPYEIPFLSIDSGTLGFLTRTPPDAIEETFAEILEGRATVTEYQQVQVTGPETDEIGVNEVRFDAFEPVTETETALGDPDTVQQCTLAVFVDGEYVGTYDGGGLLINTPTGSTAMALSAGGPVHLPADNETLQLTPLHTANTGVRPILVEASAEITVVPSTTIRVSVDGVRPEFVAQAGTTFQVTGAKTPLSVVDTTHSTTILDALREKLGWNSGQTPTQITRQETVQGPTDLYTTAADIAQEAAYATGRPIRQMYERIEGSDSGLVSDDLVGAAISRSEQIITTILQTEFPDHSIVSEGWTVNDDSDTYTWVIDPLDGAGNFTHGNPSFTVAISLLAENTPVVGVVYSPVTEELFSAVSGQGAYRNETPIETTAKQRLDESMLLSGYDPTGAFLKRFYRKVRGVRRLGSASLHLCYVAAGSADAHWEYDTYPWDVAAGLCILREAGGTATHADGTSYELSFEDTGARASLLSSNGSLHDTLLDAFPDDGF